MLGCGPKKPKTALETYAKTLRNGSAVEEEAPMLFPMFTLELSNLLCMPKLEPFEVLQAAQLLVNFSSTTEGKAVFVSHQWVELENPDPDFRQLRVLQEALKHLTVEVPQIPLDVVTEAFIPSARPLDSKTLFAQTLYIWYDYFSVPQSVENAWHSEGYLAKAIRSIPAYVAKCAFFMALCPVIDTKAGRVLTPATWGRRGWCRLERACRELSANGTWVLIQGKTRMQLLGTPLAFPAGPIGEGDFSVDEDRVKLAPVLREALAQRLRTFLKSGDLVSYRALLNLQGFYLRGLPAEPATDFVPGFEKKEADGSFPLVDRFLYQNGFNTAHDADAAGLTPLYCAALAGNTALIDDLLKLRADINSRSKKALPRFSLIPQMSALDMCTFFRHTDAARLLLAHGSKTQGPMGSCIVVASSENNPQGVRMLLDSGSSPLATNLFGTSALESACAQGSLAALEELLTTGALGPLELSRALVEAGCSRGCSVELVERLPELRADVNHQFDSRRYSKLGRTFFAVKSFQHRVGRSTALTAISYHKHGLTPLMAAVLTGQYDGAAALIAAGARLDLRNCRNWTAADFAEGEGIPNFLSQGLKGQPAECEKVRELAMQARLLHL
eukprot:s404_g2.t1